MLTSRLEQAMSTSLVDTGPLVGLFLDRDQFHSASLDYFRGATGPLATTWAIVSEMLHLIGRHSHAIELDAMRWLDQSPLTIYDMNPEAFTLSTAMMVRYADRPMDFADATLVVAAMQTGIRDIATIDSDFDFYRLQDRTRLRNVFAPFASARARQIARANQIPIVTKPKKK